MLRQGLLAACLSASLGAPATAAIYIDVAEFGPELVFSFEGSLDLRGMTAINGGNDSTMVMPQYGAILFAGPSAGMDLYDMAKLPVFGDAFSVSGSVTGDVFKVFSDNHVGFVAGYGGETISGSLTVAGSILSLGLADGVYETFAASGDFIRLTIGGTAAVPAPAGGALLLGALGLFGLVRRQRG